MLGCLEASRDGKGWKGHVLPSKRDKLWQLPWVTAMKSDNFKDLRVSVWRDDMQSKFAHWILNEWVWLASEGLCRLCAVIFEYKKTGILYNQKFTLYKKFCSPLRQLPAKAYRQQVHTGVSCRWEVRQIAQLWGARKQAKNDSCKAHLPIISAFGWRFCPFISWIGPWGEYGSISGCHERRLRPTTGWWKDIVPSWKF